MAERARVREIDDDEENSACATCAAVPRQGDLAASIQRIGKPEAAQNSVVSGPNGTVRALGGMFGAAAPAASGSASTGPSTPSVNWL